MVHDRCVVGVCNNDKRYPERLEAHSNVTSGNISFHKLPANLERRRAWIHAVEKGRKDFVVPKHFKVCSNHFIDGKPTPNNPDPTLFLTVTMNVQGTPVKKKARPSPKSRQICFQSPHSSTSTESEGFVETMEVENSFIEPDEEVDIEPLVFMF